MELARFDNIIAIKTDSGEVVGFHAHNLHVAHLDRLVWETLKESSTSPQAAASQQTIEEVRQEILAWNKENDESVGDIRLKQSVRSLTINVSQICNLKCTYCAAGGDGTYGSRIKEIDLGKLEDQLRMLLHDVPNGGSFAITFLGGEPLIYPEAISAIARFARLQVAGRDIRLRFDIVTNGTLITPVTAELLASLRANVTISLDGTAEVNDRNRPTAGGRGSTEKTLKGLANLMQVRDRLGSVHVAAIFGKHNLDVVGTYRYLKTLGFDSYKFDFAAEAGDAEASEAYARGIAEIGDLAFREGGEAELRKIVLFDRYFDILDRRKRVHDHCGAGKTHMQIDTSNKMYACQWFVNDPKEELGRETTIDQERLQAYADPIRELNGCRTCWARHLCGGGCMFVHKVKTGSKHAPDKEFCTRTRSIIAKGIEYYAQARYQNDEGDGREVH